MNDLILRTEKIIDRLIQNEQKRRMKYPHPLPNNWSAENIEFMKKVLRNKRLDNIHHERLLQKIKVFENKCQKSCTLN